jgi:hypothetical protein
MSQETRARRRDGWRATRLSNEAFTLLAQGRAAEAAAGGGGSLERLLGSATTALIVHAYALGEGTLLQWSVELERRDPVLSMQLEQIVVALDADPAVFSQACERFGGPPG